MHYSGLGSASGMVQLPTPILKQRRSAQDAQSRIGGANTKAKSAFDFQQSAQTSVAIHDNRTTSITVESRRHQKATTAVLNGKTRLINYQTGVQASNN
jgi:hypothetical protein